MSTYWMWRPPMGHLRWIVLKAVWPLMIIPNWHVRYRNEVLCLLGRNFLRGHWLVTTLKSNEIKLRLLACGRHILVKPSSFKPFKPFVRLKLSRQTGCLPFLDGHTPCTGCLGAVLRSANVFFKVMIFYRGEDGMEAPVSTMFCMHRAECLLFSGHLLPVQESL